jgi:hypothetical protein
LGFGGGLRRSRCIDIGLLLGRIEPSQHVAGLDVGADIGEPCDNAAAYPKGEVGAETGLDFAGQGRGTCSIERLDQLGAHVQGAIRSSRAIIAGTQHRRHKRNPEGGACLLADPNAPIKSPSHGSSL